MTAQHVKIASLVGGHVCTCSISISRMRIAELSAFQCTVPSMDMCMGESEMCMGKCEVRKPFLSWVAGMRRWALLLQVFLLDRIPTALATVERWRLWNTAE